MSKKITRVNLDMTSAMATLPKTGSKSVVEYKPVISDVGADANIVGLPNTYYGIVPKGTGKITLHESKPAQQEPVAYAVYHRMGGGKSFHWPEQHSPNGDANEYQLVPLYTSPPAQRTWVGLTDVERVGVQYESHKKKATPLEFMELHEAKLKEKNT